MHTFPFETKLQYLGLKEENEEFVLRSFIMILFTLHNQSVGHRSPWFNYDFYCIPSNMVLYSCLGRSC